MGEKLMVSVLQWSNFPITQTAPPENTDVFPQERLLQQILMSLLIFLHQWVDRYFMWCQRGQPVFLPSSRTSPMFATEMDFVFLWESCSLELCVLLAFCGKGKAFQQFPMLLLENMSHPGLLSSFCVEWGKEMIYPLNCMLCIVLLTSLPGSPWDLRLYISLLLFADCIKDFYLLVSS